MLQAACLLYQQLRLQSDLVENGEALWNRRMPGLYYSEGSPAYTIENIGYVEVALPRATNSEMRYVLAAVRLGLGVGLELGLG